MSLQINGMDMPKKVMDNKRQKIWKIRNYSTGLLEQFEAASIPCNLNLNHNGTVELVILGKTYLVVEIPTPHGELIDRDDVIDEINRIFPCHSDEYEWAYTTVEQADTIIEAEQGDG